MYYKKIQKYSSQKLGKITIFIFYTNHLILHLREKKHKFKRV